MTDCVSWLVTCPASDLNFKNQLKRATAEEIRGGTGNHRGPERGQDQEKSPPGSPGKKEWRDSEWELK